MAAHAVHPGPGRACRRAQVGAVDAGGIRIDGDSGPQQQLPQVVGPGGDIAAHVVGVVGLERHRPGDVHAHDAVTGAGGKALELVQQHVGGVAGVAVGDMCIRPHRVHVTHRPAGVGQVLLGHQHERPGRHPTGGHVGFGGHDLFERATNVHRARPTTRLGSPRNPAFHSQVYLVRRRPVFPACVRPTGPGGELVSGNGGQRRWGSVEHGQPVRRKIRK